ncbi:AMP-binding protein [Rhodococcus hoagii]|nr:AMP-binding protein [Prescottella equi]
MGHRPYRRRPVMLDPAHPSSRLAGMLAASGAVIGVSTGDHIADLPTGTQWLDVADVDSIDEVRQLTDMPVHPDHPAYIVFTSGTTGVPKGIVLTARGLGALAQDLREVFTAGAPSRMLALASPGSTRPCWSCWWPRDPEHASSLHPRMPTAERIGPPTRA